MIEIPKRQNITAYVVSIFLLAIIVMSVVFLMLGAGEKYIWQFVFAVSFVLLSQLSLRYLMTCYEYILTPPDELHISNQLTIVKVMGKKRSVLCNISLYNVDEAILITNRKEYIKKYKKSISKTKGTKYNFCIDMFPEKFCILKLSSEYEEAYALIQCSDSFFLEMRSRI